MPLSDACQGLIWIFQTIIRLLSHFDSTTVPTLHGRLNYSYGPLQLPNTISSRNTRKLAGEEDGARTVSPISYWDQGNRKTTNKMWATCKDTAIIVWWYKSIWIELWPLGIYASGCCMIQILWHYSVENTSWYMCGHKHSLCIVFYPKNNL